MGKGFPSFYVDSLSKNIYNKDVSIDTLSINPQSKIKAGMTVKLYRKTKSKFIPYYEAGKLVKGTPDAEGKIAVAEGKTIITKNYKGEDETIVEFKELIVNMSAEDKYFIKAVIPEKKQSQYWSPYGIDYNNKGKGVMGYDKVKGPANGALFMDVADAMETMAPTDPVYDEDQDLVAPEMEVYFPKTKLVNGKTEYRSTVKYKLLSTIPPLSQLKGELTYRWPSDPNVVRPLANARFKIVLTYLINNEPMPPAQQESACDINLTKIEWNNSKNPGDKTYLDRSDEALVVGTGETDAQGNFTIKVINHNKKGILTNSATITQTTVKNPVCDKGNQKEVMPWDQKDWGINEEFGAEIMKNGWDYGMNGNNMLDFSGGATAQNGWGSNKGYSANGFDSKNLGQNFGSDAANKGGYQGSGKSMKGIGPADPNMELAPEDVQKYEVKRGFYIALDNEWAKYYNGFDGPNNSDNFFTVDAFETKDLGTYTAIVNEVQTVKAKKILITVKSPANKGKVVQNYGLTGAKCVIFRLPNTKTPHKPEGEGSSNHPSKKLLKPVFSDN
ncbi:MAG: hypothetical protein IT244_13130 [Bacteroidia bacterium]|nr:hypothetical protein [Bacteroidia bacterium]